MRKIVAIGLAIAASLAVASCTTTGSSKLDDAIQEGLPKTCSALQLAAIAFDAAAATGKIKVSTVSKVDAAYAGVQVICADPANTTAIDALVRAAQAYVVISQALQDARAASDG